MKLSDIYEEVEDQSSEENEMMVDIEKSFKKQFPNGWFNIGKGRGISSDTISISLGLIGNKNDLTSGIRHNDPMHHSFMLFSENDDKYSAEVSIARISVNPKEKYLAMSTVKTKWRKTKGDAKKMTTTFDRFFKKLKDLIKEHGDDIYQREKYDNKYFK